MQFEGKIMCLLCNKVIDVEIVEVLVCWMGILVFCMMESECEKLLCMEQELYYCVIGQNEVVDVVFNVICCSCVGLVDLNCLIGLFLFFGLIGVGKIEFCKVLVNFMFDSDEVMVCIDMFEFMEKYLVFCLVGVFLGYVGYEEGGYLIEVVCCCLYFVILLDEVEKVYLDVFNILLQVLDDGCLIDGQGRMVDFCNMVVIMIFNFGFDLIQECFGELDYVYMKELVFGVVSYNFCLEFINCIDEVVVFYLLGEQYIVLIVQIQLKCLYKCLEECGYEIYIFDEVLKLLSENGYDLVYGVCFLKCVIQQQIENLLVQ